MSLKSDIQHDTVAIKWLRTAATTITATAAALGVVWAAVSWTLAPRVYQWANETIQSATAELAADTARAAEHLDRLDAVVDTLEENVAKLGEAVAGSSAPSWRFDLPSTSVSDGEVGGEVTITAGGFKLRECGIPRVDLYFVNGRGIYHRFINTSLLSSDNRGVAFPVAPDRLQTVSYTAEIPADDGVTPGRAQGFIAVTYPDKCPAVEEVVAGPLQFRITRGATSQ